MMLLLLLLAVSVSLNIALIIGLSIGNPDEEMEKIIRREGIK